MTELRDLVARHCRRAVVRTAIPRLTLAHAGAASGLTDSNYHPLLCVVVAGRKRVFVGDRTFDYDPATYLVASAELPASAQVVEGPCLSCVLTLDAGTLASLMFDLPPGHDETEDPAAPMPAMAVHALGADLLDPLLRLARLLDHPADAPVLAPLAEREILYRLLRGPCGPTLRQMVRPDSQLSRVRRAIDVIRRQYNQPLAVEGLARVAGMSVTSLHRHFRAVTAMSPLQFQKQVRLLEARSQLLGRGGDAASVGYAVGYQSASQFSREYRRRFGAPPRRDLARARMAGQSV